jgi:tetratricopeptide (TPR) repeat protein
MVLPTGKASVTPQGSNTTTPFVERSKVGTLEAKKRQVNEKPVAKKPEDKVVAGSSIPSSRPEGKASATDFATAGALRARGSGDPLGLRLLQDDFLRPESAATGPEVTAALDEAAKLQKAGKPQDAVNELLAVVNDTKLDRTDRAVAAVEIARITLRADGPDRTRAELFYLKAVGLNPAVPGGKRLYLDLLDFRRRTTDGLKVVDELLKDTPEDVPLLRHKAKLLLRDADDADATATANALKVAKQALAVAKKQKATGRGLERAKLTHAYALYRNRKPKDAVKAYKEILADTSASDSARFAAHAGIAELVLPKHQGKPTGEAKKKFDAANAAYKAGDYDKVKTLALEILKLDPDDGLAHQMFCIAVRSLDEAKAKTPLIEPLNSKAKRDAVLKHFTDIVARARVGTPKRAAVPKDLFPEWDILSPLQRATVAYSVLGYGKLIPKLIELKPKTTPSGVITPNGAKYRLVGVGTSATAVDKVIGPTLKNGWGRHYYAIRGYHYEGFVVTGVEDIDAAARGRYNTITHEFAHLVHGLLGRESEAARFEEAKAKAEGRAPKIPADRAALAKAYDDIEALFLETQVHKNGEKFLDGYSGQTVREYFAQGVMAYLNPHGGGEENARRLFGRNPTLWKFTKAFTEAYRDFPAAVPAVDHPPVGQDAVGSPLTLGRLIKENKADTVATARAVLLHLEALSNPKGVAEAHPEAATLTPDRREEHQRLLLQRTAELAEIQVGAKPLNFLGKPAAMIATMGRVELTAQVRAEGRRLEAAIARTTGAARKKGLEAMRAEIKDLQNVLAKNGDLAVARTKLTELHERLEKLSQP